MALWLLIKCLSIFEEMVILNFSKNPKLLLDLKIDISDVVIPNPDILRDLLYISKSKSLGNIFDDLLLKKTFVLIISPILGKWGKLREGIIIVTFFGGFLKPFAFVI